jgi:hypothetical protein
MIHEEHHNPAAVLSWHGVVVSYWKMIHEEHHNPAAVLWWHGTGSSQPCHYNTASGL